MRARSSSQTKILSGDSRARDVCVLKQCIVGGLSLHLCGGNVTCLK